VRSIGFDQKIKYGYRQETHSRRPAQDRCTIALMMHPRSLDYRLQPQTLLPAHDLSITTLMMYFLIHDSQLQQQTRL
jgi:hypothetical protein